MRQGFRRERTAIAVGLASPFNFERTRRVKPFNFDQPSIARAVTRNFISIQVVASSAASNAH
jgi:hypothetical protein